MALINKLTNKLKYASPAVDILEIQTQDIMSTSSYMEENKSKKQSKNKKTPANYVALSNQEIKDILDKTVVNIFPKTGEWLSSCYSGEGLQCHLRDKHYLADWFKEILEDKGIYISKQDILNYVATSSLFEKCRHEYELEIVKWQINWMRSGGEGWLMPKGYGEFDLLFNPDVDKIFRAGIVKTLKAIKIDKEVIEEGIEKNADLWREIYMSIAFEHAYGVPITFTRKTKLEEPCAGHKENWLKLRRYEYYREHYESVDKYGVLHTDMNLSAEEARELREIVEKQNTERESVIKAWKEMKSDSKHYYE